MTEADQNTSFIPDFSSAVFRAALDSVPISVALVDAERTYICGNRFFCESYGISQSDIVGMSSQLIFCSHAEWAALGAAAYPIIRAGGTFDSEHVLKRADGSRYPARLIGRLFKVDTPRLGVIWVVDDLTESKLAQVNKAKSEFLSMMSHEMRTPLNAIIGFAGILRNAIQDAEQNAMLEKVVMAADHLLALINDVLDLSKIESGKLSISPEDFRLGSVLSGVRDLVQAQAESKGLDLRIDVSTDTPERVRGDPLRLRQCLINYLSNAVKFTPSGTVTLRARMQQRDAAGILMVFEVEDSGIGIAPEVMPRLFASFQQGDTSITRQFGGTGLGLALTKRIVMLMGGEVGVVSELGKGSRFWFSALLQPASGGTVGESRLVAATPHPTPHFETPHFPGPHSPAPRFGASHSKGAAF